MKEGRKRKVKGKGKGRSQLRVGILEGKGG